MIIRIANKLIIAISTDSRCNSTKFKHINMEQLIVIALAIAMTFLLTLLNIYFFELPQFILDNVKPFSK